jgi:hypothetical protein
MFLQHWTGVATSNATAAVHMLAVPYTHPILFALCSLLVQHVSNQLGDAAGLSTVNLCAVCEDGRWRSSTSRWCYA